MAKKKAATKAADKSKGRGRPKGSRNKAPLLPADLLGLVEVISVDEIRPSTYNPRQVFKNRLELVKLSLGKLGFLLPIYVDPDGEILSGHQRHFVAVEMLGAKFVPIVRTRKMKGAERKSLNMLFNRALAADEPVATPRGWLPIGEIDEGDEVFGVDGKTTTVLAKTDRGERPVFDVAFSDGTIIRADAEHLWTIERTNSGNTGYCHRETITTQEIAEHRRQNRFVRVPLAGSLDLAERELPADPYWLGAMLGDGTFYDYGLRFVSADQWLIDEVTRLSPAGCLVNEFPGKRTALQVGIVGGSRGGVMHNPALEIARDLGVAGVKRTKKFVPEQYLWASAEQRLALLQGLMDTDGCVGPSGITPIFTNTSRKLCEAVEFLAQSLGGVAKTREMRTEVGPWSTAYQTSVRIPGVVPFRLPRKVAAYKGGRPRGAKRQIISVTPAGKAHCYCITVDAPDHLFLARGLVPTHNSTNDMSVVATSEPLSAALEKSNVPELAKDLPWLDVSSDDFMPVLRARETNVCDLLDANDIWFDDSSISLAIRAAKLGKTELMPCVVTEKGNRIVNGRARAAAAGKLGMATIKTVPLPDENFEVAHGLLNLLSMKYEGEGTLADDLRANAFRAAPSVRHYMSVNSVNELLRGKNPLHFDQHKEEHQKAWVDHYGPNTLDFGAGNYWDAMHAEKMGANVAAFEPYFAWDRTKARAMAEEWFFRRVIDKREFQSIFLSNVVNTIPFESDRNKVAIIIGALSGPSTKLYSSGRHIVQAVASTRSRSDKTNSSVAGNSIQIDGEPGVIITSVMTKPSALSRMWNVAFESVESWVGSSYVFCRASDPKPVDYPALVDAIEFEFNLPFSDGTRLNLVDRAIEVFSVRLDHDLSKYMGKKKPSKRKAVVA